MNQRPFKGFSRAWRHAIDGLVLCCCLGLLAGAVSAEEALPSPLQVGGERFWEYWGDGHAELASYDLTYPRYGEPRRSTAVTITVRG